MTSPSARISQTGNHIMTKDELRDALSAVDKAIAKAEERAKPARAVLKPFTEAIDKLQEKRDTLLEENETVYYGKCEGCRLILFEGDHACRYGEDGDYLCEECAPTLAEVLTDWETNKNEMDPAEYEEATTYLKARLDAGESADMKLVSPLRIEPPPPPASGSPRPHEPPPRQPFGQRGGIGE